MGWAEGFANRCCADNKDAMCADKLDVSATLSTGGPNPVLVLCTAAVWYFPDVPSSDVNTWCSAPISTEGCSGNCPSNNSMALRYGANKCCVGQKSACDVGCLCAADVPSEQREASGIGDGVWAEGFANSCCADKSQATDLGNASQPTTGTADGARHPCVVWILMVT